MDGGNRFIPVQGLLNVDMDVVVEVIVTRDVDVVVTVSVLLILVLKSPGSASIAVKISSSSKNDILGCFLDPHVGVTVLMYGIDDELFANVTSTYAVTTDDASWSDLSLLSQYWSLEIDGNIFVSDVLDTRVAIAQENDCVVVIVIIEGNMLYAVDIDVISAGSGSSLQNEYTIPHLQYNWYSNMSIPNVVVLWEYIS